MIHFDMIHFDMAKPGPGKKPAKRSAGKSLMNCPGREAKAELRMKNESGLKLPDFNNLTSFNK